jgi:hypothetical protein
MITPAESTRVVEFWSTLEVHARVAKRQATARIGGDKAKGKALWHGLLFDCMVYLTIFSTMSQDDGADRLPWQLGTAPRDGVEVRRHRCPDNLEQAYDQRS